MIGLLIVVFISTVALLSPVLARTDPGVPVLADTLLSPSVSHPLGTDELGRDQLDRVIHGARVSLGVSAAAMAIAVSLGVTIGLAAGFFEGWLGAILMRIMDSIQAFPAVLLAIAVASTLGPGVGNATIAIGIVGIPGFARLARGEVLRLKEVEFTVAAEASGAKVSRVIVRHILPNAMAPLIIATATGSAGAILTEAALSFVGLGATPPVPSWGGMLQAGYPYMTLAPWLAIFPGLAISIATVGFVFLGDGLRDILDPRMRTR